MTYPVVDCTLAATVIGDAKSEDEALRIIRAHYGALWETVDVHHAVVQAVHLREDQTGTRPVIQAWVAE